MAPPKGVPGIVPAPIPPAPDPICCAWTPEPSPTRTTTMPPNAQAYRNALLNYGTTITSPIRRKKLPGTAFPLRISSYCTGIST